MVFKVRVSDILESYSIFLHLPHVYVLLKFCLIFSSESVSCQLVDLPKEPRRVEENFFLPNSIMWCWHHILGRCAKYLKYAKAVHQNPHVLPMTFITSHQKSYQHTVIQSRQCGGKSQDGGGIGRGDHFLSYKFIKRTIERWTKFTKQLLIASSGHQAPRKATHCLRREVGQNIKDKKGDKRARDRVLSREGSLNRGSFQSPETLALVGLREVFESWRAT